MKEMKDHNPTYETEEFKEVSRTVKPREREEAQRIMKNKKFQILDLLPIECWNGEKQRSNKKHKRNILRCGKGTGIAQWEDENGQIFYIAAVNAVFRVDYKIKVDVNGKSELEIHHSPCTGLMKISGSSGKDVVKALYCEIVETIHKHYAAVKVQRSMVRMIERKKNDKVSMFERWNHDLYGVFSHPIT